MWRLAVVTAVFTVALAPSAHAASKAIVPFFDPSGAGSGLFDAGCEPKGIWGIPSTIGGGSLGSPNPGTTYFYEVTAVVGGVEQRPCDLMPVTVNTSAGQNSSLLQWNQTPGATGYNVYRSTNPATPQLIAPISLPSAACPASPPRCTFADTGFAENPVSPPARPAANTQAGAHTDLKIVQALTYDQDVSSDVNETNPHALKTDLIHFPPGLIANAQAAPTCEIENASGPSLLGDTTKFGSDDPNEDTCPPASFLGTVQTVSRTRTGSGTAVTSLTEGDIYNGETLGGEPGRLLIVLRPLCSAGSPVAPGSPTCTALLGSAALQVEKSFLSARAQIVDRGGGVYGIDVDTFDIKSGADEPLSPTVNVLAPFMGSLVRAGEAPIQVQRLTQRLSGYADQGTAATTDDVPFVTLPTSCSEKTLSADATLWVDDTVLSGSSTFTTTGCGSVPFEPGTNTAVDTEEVEHPVQFTNGTALCPDPLVSGCSTDDDPIHQSHVKSLQVTFPRGLNLSAGAGNAVSSVPAQIGAITGFSDELGTLQGSLILQAVHTDSAGRFNGTFDVRAEITDTKPSSDTELVLNGTGTADPATGQITTTFSDLPEVPFKNLQFIFGGGATGALVNPPTCGTHTVTQVLTPHSGGADESVADSFTTSYDGAGASCPNPRPFAPDVLLSADPTTAAAFTKLTTTINRADKSQALSSFNLDLPPGMLAKIGDFPLCPNASADAGTCADTSQVGTVAITTGSDGGTVTLNGKIFLGEPITGTGDLASLVVAIPAVVGPFNLGTVVSRARLAIHFSEGQISVTTTGKLPTILGGIPVRIQSLKLTIDRANFQHNPSSCAPKTLGASFTSQGDPTTAETAAEGGVTSTDSAPFQATGCENVPFAPKLSGTVGGAGNTGEGDHAALDVTITQAADESSTKSAKVTLPAVFGAGLDAIANACTEAQLATASCPASSIVGNATASSSLLPANPLTGPVFLIQQTGALPRLIVALFGPLNLGLDGKIEVSDGQLVNSFDNIPDVPLSSFKLHIDGGPAGLLQNTADLCKGVGTLEGVFTGYNGKVATPTGALELVGAPCSRASRPKVSIVLSQLASGEPVLVMRVRRGGSNANSALTRARFILPPGLRFAPGAAGGLGVRASRRLGRGALRVGRRTLIVKRLPGGTSPRVLARFFKGTLKASKALQRKGTGARPRFRLRVKVRGGRVFKISRRVRPRS